MELFIIVVILIVLKFYLEDKRKQRKQKKEYEQWKKNWEKYNQSQQAKPQQKPHWKDNYSFHYDDYSYMPYKKANLLTKTEYAFFVMLVREALKRRLLVCPKVRLEDIASVTDRKNEDKYRGYVKSRHIDFILINAQGNTIAGIELDDPSHESDHAKKVDTFKDELFKNIGVPLFRIPTGTDYAAQLSNAFDQLSLDAEPTSQA